MSYKGFDATVDINQYKFVPLQKTLALRDIFSSKSYFT